MRRCRIRCYNLTRHPSLCDLDSNVMLMWIWPGACTEPHLQVPVEATHIDTRGVAVVVLEVVVGDYVYDWTNDDVGINSDAYQQRFQPTYRCQAKSKSVLVDGYHNLSRVEKQKLGLRLRTVSKMLHSSKHW